MLVNGVEALRERGGLVEGWRGGWFLRSLYPGEKVERWVISLLFYLISECVSARGD